MKKLMILLVIFFVNFAISQDLFFSEYIEGSNNNKALEIYNPTGAAVNLGDYIIRTNYNGNAWSGVYTFPEGATLDAGDVFVAAHAEAFAEVVAVADSAYPYAAGAYITSFNGDDVRALCTVSGVDTTIIDIIGLYDMVDPGDGWSVAGTDVGTKEHTIVRKASVTTGNTDWASSAGTTAEDSEWEVYDQNTFDYLGVHPGMLSSTIMVTLQLNTSTNLDTITADNGFIQVRGELAGDSLGGGKQITWGSDSDLGMESVGGDYWNVTFEMETDDTLKYKFWTGFNGSTGTNPDGGWEGGITNETGSGDTRVFISGANDTVVQVQYYNPNDGNEPVDQYAAPFESKTDSLAIYFRVSMAGEIEAAQFNPDINGPVGLRGDPATSGGTIDWGENRVVLIREIGSQFDDSFYSGVAYFDKDSVEAGASQKYKFVFGEGGGATWEGIDGDRLFNYPMGLKDSTIQWAYFSDKKPTGKETIASVITWRVSTEALEAIGLFDRGVGDRIQVRGPRRWGTTNEWDTHEDAVQLVFNPLLQEWTSTNEEFLTQEGSEINYKYYIGWDSSRVDSTSPNYIPNLNIAQGWEEPAPTGGGNRVHAYENAAEQTVTGDFGFDRQFFNGVPANAVSDHDIAVTFSVDMTQATEGANNTNTLFRPGVDTVWVQWDGELTAWSQGTGMWAAEARFLMLTDGDGDMVYTGTYNLEVSETFPGIWFQLGYRIAYSTDAEAVVNGTGGAVKGRRYYQYIHPSSVNEGSGQWLDTEWPNEYALPQVPWTETDLLVEDPPDLTVTGIVGVEKLPNKYELGQNYPNPFNPTTTIKYQLAKQSDVKIHIFNLMGQKVKTLVNEKKPTGRYEVVWNGQNSSNNTVASGVYFIQMEADNFTQVRKMTLIR